MEQGVRFVQLFDWGWDMHGTGRDSDLKEGLPNKCRSVDQPVAALIKESGWPSSVILPETGTTAGPWVEQPVSARHDKVTR